MITLMKLQGFWKAQPCTEAAMEATIEHQSIQLKELKLRGYTEGATGGKSSLDASSCAFQM